MAIHVQTLFTHDDQSQLLFVNEPGKTKRPAPCFFLGRTPSGNLWRFPADLPENLIEELQALYLDEPISGDYNRAPRHYAAYLNLLENQAPLQNISLGPAYQCGKSVKLLRPLESITLANADMLQDGFDKLIPELTDWQPFLALIKNGRAVSVCCSVRISLEAHEAGVETLSNFRGKGHAADVVLGWANIVQLMGVVPFYSTTWRNHASQAVAKKLRLVMFGTDFHFT
jgi:hypothetical protein